MSNQVKPFFVAFEGPDFCGKTTMRVEVAKWLRTRISNEVVETREPGGTPLAEEIRELLLKRRDEPFNPMAELFCFMAGRIQHTEEMIKPKLELGNVVLSDRYTDSSYAMQCHAVDDSVVDTLDFLKVEEIALKGFRPDLVVFLDIDPRVAMARQSDVVRAKDRIELKGIEYHDAVREGFQVRHPHTTERSLVLDAELPVAENLEKIKEHLELYFL
jgi:dTMP kinase